MTPEELIALRRVASVSPSPDGNWLAVAAQRLDEDKQKYVTDLWRVPVAGGDAVQLTSGSHNDASPTFRHDGALLFLSNRPTPTDDEGKRAQVWMFRPAGGDPIPVTDEALGVEAFEVARNTDVMVVKTSLLPEVDEDKQRETAKERSEKGPTAIRYTAMPVRFWDHWLPDHLSHFAVYRNGERKPGFGDPTYRDADFSLSANGERLGITRRGGLGDDRLADTIVELWDVQSLECKASHTESRCWLGRPVFSKNEGVDDIFLERTRRTGEHAPATDVVRWQGNEASWKPVVDDFEAMSLVDVTQDGQLVVVGEYQGTTPVWLVDTKTGELTRITSKAAAGTHSGVSMFEREDTVYVCGVRSGLTQAPEPFVVPLTADAEPEIVANISGWSAPSGVDITQAWVPSTDGEPIHYFTVGPDDQEERPLLLWIHGGPMNAWGDIWHWRWNPYIPVAQGFRVVLPNPRGSTGYGYEFRNGIWGNVWGGQCYEDLMAVTDEVQAKDDVDASRMVAMGGSFGGYMTNWIGGATDRFACLVVHAGLASFETFHGITDNPAWWAAMFGLDPFEDLDDLRLYSPITNVSKWASPTMIIHGQMDYRVPVGEALVMFEALQKCGVPSELLIFPDENHWILRPRNIVTWYDEFLGFIERNLAQ